MTFKQHEKYASFLDRKQAYQWIMPVYFRCFLYKYRNKSSVLLSTLANAIKQNPTLSFYDLFLLVYEMPQAPTLTTEEMQTLMITRMGDDHIKIEDSTFTEEITNEPPYLTYFTETNHHHIPAIRREFISCFYNPEKTIFDTANLILSKKSKEQAASLLTEQDFLSLSLSKAKEIEDKYSNRWDVDSVYADSLETEDYFYIKVQKNSNRESIKKAVAALTNDLLPEKITKNRALSDIAAIKEWQVLPFLDYIISMQPQDVESDLRQHINGFIKSDYFNDPSGKIDTINAKAVDRNSTLTLASQLISGQLHQKLKLYATNNESPPDHFLYFEKT
jgi:hypothetical protein